MIVAVLAIAWFGIPVALVAIEHLPPPILAVSVGALCAGLIWATWACIQEPGSGFWFGWAVYSVTLAGAGVALFGLVKLVKWMWYA